MPDKTWDNLSDRQKKRLEKAEKKFMGRDLFTPAQRGEVPPGPNDGWRRWTASQLLALYRHCPGRTIRPPVPVPELMDMMRHAARPSVARQFSSRAPRRARFFATTGTPFRADSAAAILFVGSLCVALFVFQASRQSAGQKKVLAFEIPPGPERAGAAGIVEERGRRPATMVLDGIAFRAPLIYNVR